LRDGATAGAATLDEYKAPLVATWQAGLGRVVCFTGEADGEYAGEFARWKDVGEFYASLARWAVGPAGRPGDDLLATQAARGGVAGPRRPLAGDRGPGAVPAGGAGAAGGPADAGGGGVYLAACPREGRPPGAAAAPPPAAPAARPGGELAAAGRRPAGGPPRA